MYRVDQANTFGTNERVCDRKSLLYLEKLLINGSINILKLQMDMHICFSRSLEHFP